MIVVSAFEPPAIVAGLDDVAVMGQPVEQRNGHLGVAEHARPFAEGEIGSDDDGGAFVEPANKMEEKLTAGLGKGQGALFCTIVHRYHAIGVAPEGAPGRPSGECIEGTHSRGFCNCGVRSTPDTRHWTRTPVPDMCHLPTHAPQQSGVYSIGAEGAVHLGYDPTQWS